MGQRTMEGLNILMTGSEGYLGSALSAKLKRRNTVTPFIGDVRSRVISPNEYLETVDMLIHFASPIDNTDPQKTASTIIEGTVNMVWLAQKLNARFIYASTLGVEHEHELDDTYITCKLAMENYVRSVYNRHMILRIPRVYSKCRDNGLMSKLRNNKVPKHHMNNQVEYMTLDEFVNTTIHALEIEITAGIYTYQPKHKQTLTEIKQWLDEY